MSADIRKQSNGHVEAGEVEGYMEIKRGKRGTSLTRGDV